MKNNPSTFISYAWESSELKKWVKFLATKLRSKGIDVKLDDWEIAPGDQLPHFMEKSVKENEYILIICTPDYKLKSENRIGGVGYEGDIMTAEVLQRSNHRKFIPILKLGTKESAIPSWLQGKYFIDLSSDSHFDNNFEDLLTTLLNKREVPPTLGKLLTQKDEITTKKIVNIQSEELKIKGVIVDEVSKPLNDGSAGSALYKIPFELNKQPDTEWSILFIEAWNHPPRYTTMHRPGIASIRDNKIFLDGTTIEEVERYHKDTLKLAVEVANKEWNHLKERKKQNEERKLREIEEHTNNIKDISKRINFED